LNKPEKKEGASEENPFAGTAALRVRHTHLNPFTSLRDESRYAPDLLKLKKKTEYNRCPTRRAD
jgi:hypothetical protein